jgi:hypothetical protein
MEHAQKYRATGPICWPSDDEGFLIRLVPLISVSRCEKIRDVVALRTNAAVFIVAREGASSGAPVLHNVWMEFVGKVLNGPFVSPCKARFSIWTMCFGMSAN